MKSFAYNDYSCVNSHHGTDRAFATSVLCASNFLSENVNPVELDAYKKPKEHRLPGQDSAGTKTYCLVDYQS